AASFIRYLRDEFSLRRVFEEMVVAPPERRHWQISPKLVPGTCRLLPCRSALRRVRVDRQARVAQAAGLGQPSAVMVTNRYRPAAGVFREFLGRRRADRSQRCRQARCRRTPPGGLGGAAEGAVHRRAAAAADAAAPGGRGGGRRPAPGGGGARAGG